MKSGSQHETSAPTTWDQWLVRHAPGLLLFARQQTRCEADAQDLVQDAVVECWRQQQLQVGPPSLGMVYATIRRRAVDLARRQDRRAHREAAVSQDKPAWWFDSTVEDREKSQVLQQAMCHLPEIYRDVVSLRIWGDLTFVEVAEVLAIPTNTAASRYRYGLAELRKLTREVLA